MPKRTGDLSDRQAVERALSPVLRLALEELRELGNVEDWRRTPLGPVFEFGAVAVEARRLEAEEGTSTSAARDLAALTLRIDQNTAKSRAQRWPKASRRGGCNLHLKAPAKSRTVRQRHQPTRE